MSTPEPLRPTPWPEDPPQNPTFSSGPQIRAVDGNRAALMLLVVQNVVSALLIGQLHLGLGMALLLSFAATVAVAFGVFPAQMRALAADTRWRTRPTWGTALGAFALAFLASRAFALAYVTLVPGSASTVPQFLSHGPDLIILVVAAGLLIPFAEEVAFRGLMMRGQERAAGFTVAALATSFAFGIAHGVPASIAGILPLAYVLARVVQHSGSLWNSVIIHALNNTISVALGAFLAGNNLGNQDEAMNLVKSEALRLPLGIGAVLFGIAVLFVAHMWLTPKPDPQVGSRRGPWLSGAYVGIVLFGLAAIVTSIPAVQIWISQFQNLHR